MHFFFINDNIFPGQLGGDGPRDAPCGAQERAGMPKGTQTLENLKIQAPVLF